VSDKSKIRTELDFLYALERGEVVTQMTLSKRISVSIGLINSLLKRAVRKGYVKAKAAPYKRYAYYLTPKGFSEKSRLVAEYLEVSLDFFRSARQEYIVLLLRARAGGARRIAFVGGGELAEIALMAAREAEIEVSAILDRTTNGDRLHGLAVVRSPEDLASVDAVAITDSRLPQEAFDLVRHHFADGRILAPPFLRITREPPDFKPKVVPK
jgi:DNA-binding MarR family transcriptional regulator